MWIGTTKFLISSFVAIAAFASAMAAEVSLVSVDVPSSIKYAEWTKEESQSSLAESISKVLGLGLDKENQSFYGLSATMGFLKDLGIDLSKPKQRTPENFSLLAEKAKTRFLLYIQVEKVSQKNASEGAILGNLGKPESDTTVELNAVLFDVEGKLLLKWPDQGAIKSTFKGPYFGTVKRDEMSGDPQSKSIMIRNEHRKRMESVGRAVWMGIKDRLLTQLNAG